MRKIWSRKDKDKRRSWTGSSVVSTSDNRLDSVNSLREEEEDTMGRDAAGMGVVPQLHPTDSNSSSTQSSPPIGHGQPHPHPLPHGGYSVQHNPTPPATYHPVMNGNRSNSVSSQSTGHHHNQEKQSVPMPVMPPVNLPSLIRTDYDHRLIKNSWMNVIINSHSNEVNEQSLRLFRAELKGSHLYLYKLLPQLNHIRSFKLPSASNSGGTPSIAEDKDASSLYKHGNNSNSTLLDNSSQLLEEKDEKESIIQKDGTAAATATEAATALEEEQDFIILHWNTSIHPELIYDFDNHIFLPNSSIESLIHFMFFIKEDEGYSVNQLIQIIPIFPNLNKILRLINLFIEGVLSDKFSVEENSPEEAEISKHEESEVKQNGGTNTETGSEVNPDEKNVKEEQAKTRTSLTQINKKIISERILMLLTNIHDNFGGFLLNSDIGPSILIVLEGLRELTKQSKAEIDGSKGEVTLSGNDMEKSTEGETEPHSDEYSFSTLKTSMLSKQQELISIISNENLTDLNPLSFISSTNLLNSINLIELANTICSIDLRFFKNWNSNLDKSLLLYNSINLDFFIKKNPLIFNNDIHIHYLSRLLIHHLFLENYSTLTASAVLERKARIIEKWIDLGCILDKLGNMLSWLGIASIILSQPILRLTRIWLLVGTDYIKLLKNDWSPVLFELDRRYLTNGVKGSSVPATSKNSGNGTAEDELKDSFHIMAPRGLGKIYYKENVIPYFGDLIITNTTIPPNINELDNVWKKINYSFNRWNEYLSNLSNYTEIIHYNNDVLRRYDSMGFIFSNESLNQVLYLGVNDDNKSHPPPQLDDEIGSSGADFTVNEDLKRNLLKLIEINCKSINLEKIMTMSLSLEQNLKESYIYLWQQQMQQHQLLSKKFLNNNGSNLSLNSGESFPLTITENGQIGSGSSGIAAKVDNPFSKIPLFNNTYFKINLAKYDELIITESGVASASPPTYDPSSRETIVIDDDLVFRVDDFVNDVEPMVTSMHFDEIDNVDIEDDVPGLGIDVDDILNSDKFNNLSIELPNVKQIPLVHLHLQHSKTSKKVARGESLSSGLTSSDSQVSTSLKYLPKYASVDRLVDLLLIDSKYFNENIKMELNEYRFIFLLNYDSFISTKEFLDKLAHRFINSGNAVISIMKKTHYTKNDKFFQLSDFVNWEIDENVDLNALGEVDYELLIKIQINILKVLIVLLNNFYSNFAVDLNNRNVLVKLLKLYSNEILQWYNSNKINNNLELSFELLVNYYKRLKKLFIKKSYRPIELSKFDEYLINEFRFNNSLHEVPINRNLPGHKNLNKIEKFLHKFNKLLMIFYKGIRVEDWMKVFKVLEYQFEAGGLMEFILQKNSINDDNLIILNIFTYMESLSDSKEKMLILKKFPLIFRKLFKLYYKFKVYLLIQLADLNITVDERLDRMKTLLIMVHLSKLKMRDHQFVWEGKGKNSGIPSCIETAITNVIYSPESRSFTNLWIKASNALTSKGSGSSNGEVANFDDINSLLPTNISSTDLIINHEPLLPCFGWIIENFIEVNKIPNFYKTTDVINFNKKYLIYKIIKEFGIEDFDDENEINYHDTREFEFLLKLDETLVRKQNIREFNLLEKDKLKLFRGILKEQHKILVIDNKKKVLREQQQNSLALASTGASITLTLISTLQSGASQSSLNSPTTSSSTVNSINGNSGTPTTVLPGSLNKKNSSSSLRRQSLSYKSNSTSRFKISGLFNKTRPFSLNVSGLGSSSPDKQCYVKELPSADSQIDPKQKPYLIIPMKNKKIFPVYLLPLCFKIDSENSNEDYFFQTSSEFDLNDWLIKLSYANRHWFFSKNLNLKISNNNLTFGIPITLICNREKSYSPSILSILFEEIENEGIKDVGIYRISTSISELNQVKQIIEKTGTINFIERTWDVHTLTSVVKSYFRDLPDALLTDNVIEQFFETKQSLEDNQEAIANGTSNGIEGPNEIESYKAILNSLPTFNYFTLKILIRHLQKISRFSEQNRMNPSNLATVIGPALTEASSLEHLVNNFGFMNSILEKLIINFNFIFDEPEVVQEDFSSGHEELNQDTQQPELHEQPLEGLGLQEVEVNDSEEIQAVAEDEANTGEEIKENAIQDEVVIAPNSKGVEAESEGSHADINAINEVPIGSENKELEKDNHIAVESN